MPLQLIHGKGQRDREVPVTPEFTDRARAGEQIEGAEYFIPMVIDADDREEVKRRFHAGLPQQPPSATPAVAE